MPTGYTAAVLNGTVTEFPVFALRCARAFGALVSMRDDDHDAEIPEVIEPHTYDAQQLVIWKARLAELQAMTDADKEAAAEAEYQANCKRWEEGVNARLCARARYTEMLEAVHAWTPPTADHQKLKQFMVAQLVDSIENDCDDRDYPVPVKPVAEKWHAWAVNAAARNVTRYEKQDREERARAAARTVWLQQLRASLKPNGENQ